ncbi:hypothetical protein ADK43_32730 [Streptomyces rimosus subsp. rimosus]|nr:hypothetical protein ADK43_32730 [Streptomyces rimosus subsp. rimosus]
MLAGTTATDALRKSMTQFACLPAGYQTQVAVRGGTVGVGALAPLALYGAGAEGAGVRGERLTGVLGAADVGAVGEERSVDVAGADLDGNGSEVGVVHAVGQWPVAVGEGGCGAFGEHALVGVAGRGQDALGHV